MAPIDLRYLVAVARERHFGRAAEACVIARPTQSVSIKKLEDVLDVNVFGRGANGASATPLGHETYARRSTGSPSTWSPRVAPSRLKTGARSRRA